MTREATYTAYIDWFNHGGLNMGLAGWHTSDTQTDATLELSSEQFIRDGQSIKVSGDAPRIFHSFNTQEGKTYTVKTWVYLETASETVFMNVRDADGNLESGGQDSTSVSGSWQELSVTFTARLDGSYLDMDTTSGTVTWFLGWAKVTGEHDDVTCDLLESGTVPKITYGRDEARDLAGIQAGTANIGLKNVTGKYSPGNTSSPIAEGLKLNRPVLIEANHDEVDYVVFSGYIDNLQIQASPNENTVDIGCTDLIGRLSEIPINTEVYESVRTGGAVNAVLESTELWGFLTEVPGFLGSTELFNPFIQTGASTLRWWSFAGTAKAALDEILQAEGIPSIYSVGSSNQIVFRDRLHRQRVGYEFEPDITFVGDSQSGTFSVSLDSPGPEYPWSRLVNKVKGSFDSQEPATEYTDVWTDDDVVTWGANSLTDGDEADFYTFKGTADNGFVDAQDPIKGVLQIIENPGPDETDVQSGILPEEHDYVALTDTASESTVEFVDDAEHPMPRSGTAISVTLQHTNDQGEASSVRGMAVRAKAIQSETITFSDEVSGSIETNRSEREEEISFGAVVRPDAEAITRLYLNNNSFTRPVLVIKLKNSTAVHTEFILGADLSQSVRVDVDEWFIDEIFTIEKIEHSIGQKGSDHEITIHLLQQKTSLSSSDNEFTFDDPDRGFDQGVFASTIINPDTVFTLGVSQLNSTDVLTY